MSELTHELDAARHFISRQVSWVEFNRRVLGLAADESRPLLDRLRFLAISGENLDGFFMKRIGSLEREIERGLPREGSQPLTAHEERAAVSEAVHDLVIEQHHCLTNQLFPALAEAGLHLLGYGQLDSAQRAHVDRYFEDELFPILTPLAVDPARPFPFISNLSLSLAVVLRFGDGAPLFARVKVPANRPRWIPLPDPHVYVPAEQVISAHLDRLFSRMSIVSAHPFRVTRSAEVPRDEAAADDLLDFAVDLVRERRFAPAVRLEIDAAMPLGPRELLMNELGVGEPMVYPCEGLLGYADLRTLSEVDLPGQRTPAWVPLPHPRLPAASPAALFEAIRERDVVVHHPYHDYGRTVGSFLDAAARDPQVLAIKQSLYRTAQQSSTLEALMRAAEAGKEVTVLLELKARLDEAANIAWARRMEQSGIHTSYGFVGFKTHTRMTLVVRQEPDGLRRYVHLSTGDYNDTTARYYSDLGLFTCDPALTADVSDFFNFLTGYADVPAYRRVVVAPTDMRQHLLDCIAREIEHCEAGRGGRIVAMMNALADVALSTALFQASQAGVAINLVVRSECCLRPGLPGVSENITVRSVLGRFLEHSRVFHFANGGQDELYIGSADWMYRNLDHRVEMIVPVEDQANRRELIELLQIFLRDNVGAWELRADGSWSRVVAAPSEPLFSAQEHLAQRAVAAQSSLA
ncbi:MAG: polyphosphate kinase 1 [Armatimonadetes bacterium]|nr:polyphosphate kinase 1 [Armatimonadota bacterium]